MGENLPNPVTLIPLYDSDQATDTCVVVAWCISSGRVKGNYVLDNGTLTTQVTMAYVDIFVAWTSLHTGYIYNHSTHLAKKQESKRLPDY
jgi:hypothetical protein